MAEYINRAKVDYEFMTTRGGGDTIINLYERILDIPTADVIERSKINKAIEEIEDLDPITERVGLQVKQEILNILKKNIGE